MSKITNDSLTRSGTGCFIAVPMCQQWAYLGVQGLGKRIVCSLDNINYKMHRFETFVFEKYRDLGIRVRVTQGHWKWQNFDRSHMTSY